MTPPAMRRKSCADMLRSLPPETFNEAGRQSLLRRIPLGRFGQASEIADAVNFLVDNEYANNCVLNLDGGLSAIL
jgi:NAD(P)-dependent dehydrogenase (short-subunit alcohol dehydrogenase family)